MNSARQNKGSQSHNDQVYDLKEKLVRVLTISRPNQSSQLLIFMHQTGIKKHEFNLFINCANMI